MYVCMYEDPGGQACVCTYAPGMCVCNRLPLHKDWMTNNREALFDMMITNEAHHYPAPTWIGLAEDLEEASPPDLCIRQIRKGIPAARGPEKPT